MDSLNFTAFDTETATNEPTSICQIGFVVVRNGEIAHEGSFLIRPPENRYWARNSCIHGIDALRTKYQPSFPEIWEMIKQYFENTLLVAHNSNFDMSVLYSTFDFYHIQRPLLKCRCTYRLSGLSLKALSEAYGIKMEKHHDALSDARTCGLAYIYMLRGVQPDYHLITEKRNKNPFAGHEQLSMNFLTPIKEVENPQNPFYSKKVVFTGVLQSLSREEAADKIQKMGADINTAISRNTDFVIVGHGAGPAKIKKIEELQAIGTRIRVIREDEFLSMIN